VFCCYRCANFAGGVLPNRAALAADWIANLAMSSRRRSFCFLNLLNLALSPFCDDICPRSCNLFVTQRAEDKSVRSSIRQATDGKMRGAGHVEEKPIAAPADPIARLAPLLPTKCPAACSQHTLFFERSAMSLRTRKLGPTQRPSRDSRKTLGLYRDCRRRRGGIGPGSFGRGSFDRDLTFFGTNVPRSA
jgi:hypothetical protein